MRLWLTPEQTSQLARYAQTAAPDEACGLLAGTGEQIREVVSLPNIAPTPRYHYRIDDEAYSKTLFRLQKSGMTVIGFYHSHPTGDPIPSTEDIRQALYPDTPYLIIGLRQGEPRMAAWRIRYGEVIPVEVYVGSEAPPAEEGKLTTAQKTAILLSAIIAFVFMIILSLSLLPPAPIIPKPFP